MFDGKLYAAMHEAADVVEVKLRKIFRQAVLDCLDCNMLLYEGTDWLGPEDPDVERLRQAIEALSLHARRTARRQRRG